MNKDEYDHIDLFSGIGGFSLGLQQAGLNIRKTYFSEIDETAISVYRRNFPDAEYLGPVESISGRRFRGRKHIVTFGFPCQDLSAIGKGEGFDGSRSSLYFEALRIIDEGRSDFFINENVKNFLSNREGRDFKIALQKIADLGVYDCEWQLLNTAWFLPQNRERLYTVGHHRGKSSPRVFPIKPETAGLHTENPGEKSLYARCLLTQDYDHWKGNYIVGDFRYDDGFRERKNGISPTLTCRQRTNGGSNQPVFIDGKSIRRFTEIEYERLQGFPDNWTKYGVDGQRISGIQRYKLCGNAVSIPVIVAIGTRLKETKLELFA